MEMTNQESQRTKTTHVIPPQPKYYVRQPTKKDPCASTIQHATTTQQHAQTTQHHAPTRQQNAPTRQQPAYTNRQHVSTIQQPYPAVVVTEPYQTRPSQNYVCLICMAVVAIFFCPILGIIAVCQVMQSRNLYAAGDNAAAKSRKIVAIVLIVLSIPVGIGASVLIYMNSYRSYNTSTYVYRRTG